MRVLKAGDIVKHFKYNLLSEEEKKTKKYLYVIVGEAIHSETHETMIIYKSLMDGTMYVRSKSMFMSEIDKDKYPNVNYKYRFELFEEV